MIRSFPRAAAFVATLALLAASPAPLPSASPDATGTVTRATLPNGLRVVIVRDPLAPVASMYENYLVGADETPSGFPGMAHAQEHMAFNGCAGVSGDQTSAIFAQLGGDGDADTQQNVTQYFSTVPASDLDVALRVDAACMRSIDDHDAQWKHERGAIEQEVAADLSNPLYEARTRLQADMFAGTPYAHDALGTRDSFDKTTGAALKAFDRAWYAPNNAILVVAGNVDPRATLATIRRLYGSIPSRPLPARPAVALQPVKPESFTLASDLPVIVSFIGYRLPGSDDSRYAASQILFDVLASQRGDIYALGPAGKALQAGAQIGASYPKAGLGIVYGVLPVGGDVAALNASLTSIVSKYAKDGVPADLVDAAKRSEIASASFERASVSGLASTWSAALANEGRTSPDDDIAAIRKVTVDDVNRVAREYLDAQKAVTAILVPKPSGKPSTAKGFGGGETLTSAPTKAVVLPSWAAAKLARVEVPPSTIAPVDMTLPNGIRLIVQPETVSPTVSVVGEIRTNSALQTPPGKEGVYDVLAGLFEFGTTDLDRLAYLKALDDISASASAGTSFSLSVLAPDFDRGVQLLADDELHPRLPDSAFAIVQRQTAAALVGQLKSPSYLAQRAIDRALLPAGDPGLRQPTPQSVSGLAPADVKAAYDTAFRPDMTTIVVVGNVTPESARATIEKYFGAWKATGPKPNVDFAPIPPNAPSSAVVPDTSRVQDRVSLVETSAITRRNSDFYALVLGDHVLGGGFYATRLYRDLRQKAGYVYFVQNQLSAGRTRSTYSVVYGSDPPNVAKARALIVRDLRAMQTTDVSPAELEQAKAILLRQLPLGESSEDAIAGALAERSLSGLPLDEAHRAAEVYAKLSAAAVRAAFAKYVRPDGFVQVVEGPNPG